MQNYIILFNYIYGNPHNDKIYLQSKTHIKIIVSQADVYIWVELTFSFFNKST